MTESSTLSPNTSPTAVRVADHPIDTGFLERWSPRAFTGEPLPLETLFSFLEAARWAPSAYNLQPWHFVYALRATPEWSPIFDTLVTFNQDWAQRASALVVVLSRHQWQPPGKDAPESIHSHAFDTGAAWAHLALQATRSGWHVHGIGGFDRDRLRLELAIPAEFTIQAVVAIGRKGDPAQLSAALQARETPSLRRQVVDSVTHGRFS